MKLTPREQRLIRQLDRPAHQFRFHLAAAAVLIVGGAVNAALAMRGHNPGDLWLGCLVGTIGVFWGERLLHLRLQRQLITKLITERER